MQPINMLMIYYWDKKFKARLHVLEADIITIKKNIDLMSLTKWIYFLLDVFQMTAIALVSVINHKHIIRLFRDKFINILREGEIFADIYIYIYMFLSLHLIYNSVGVKKPRL